MQVLLISQPFTSRCQVGNRQYEDSVRQLGPCEGAPQGDSYSSSVYVNAAS